MPTILELLEPYEEYLRHERRVAKSTRQAYLTDLQQLGQFLTGCVGAITLNDLREYQQHLSKLGRASSTIHRKFHGFGTFWQWLVWEGYATEKLTERVRLPRLDKSIKDWMPKPELQRFLETPVDRRMRRLNHRDHTAFLLMGWLGLRRSEVLNLQVSDVRFHDGMIIIRKGKGRRDRSLPLLPEFEDELRQLIGDRKGGWVFHAATGGKWRPKDLNRAFQIHLQRCGLDGKGYTPHTLRHTFATLMVRSGKDIHLVKELLGHEDLNSTEVYLHTGPVDKILALEDHFLRDGRGL